MDFNLLLLRCGWANMAAIFVLALVPMTVIVDVRLPVMQLASRSNVTTLLRIAHQLPDEQAQAARLEDE